MSCAGPVSSTEPVMNKHYQGDPMKRWAMDGVGRARLKLVDAEVPAPGATEILVKVSAVVTELSRQSSRR